LSVSEAAQHDLVLRNIEKDWKMPPVIWKQAGNPFVIIFGERFGTNRTGASEKHESNITPLAGALQRQGGGWELPS
jgi:hypothetical protein